MLPYVLPGPIAFTEYAHWQGPGGRRSRSGLRPGQEGPRTCRKRRDLPPRPSLVARTYHLPCLQILRRSSRTSSRGPARQGDVLYTDLENGKRRIQGRIRILFPGERQRPDLSRLHWVDSARQLDEGFLAALDDWRTSVTGPRLVVVDVFQRVEPVRSKSRNAYENDYAALAPLKHWALTSNEVKRLVLIGRQVGARD